MLKCTQRNTQPQGNKQQRQRKYKKIAKRYNIPRKFEKKGFMEMKDDQKELKR